MEKNYDELHMQWVHGRGVAGWRKGKPLTVSAMVGQKGQRFGNVAIFIFQVPFKSHSRLHSSFVLLPVEIFHPMENSQRQAHQDFPDDF